MNDYIQDKINTLTRQSVSAAAIIDSKGNMAGKILVCFTNGLYGWNHEVSACLFGHDKLSFGKSRKGNCYDNPTTLYKLLRDAGLTAYDWNGRKLGHYDDKRPHVPVDSLSRFSDIRTIKHGRKSYRLEWVI